MTDRIVLIHAGVADARMWTRQLALLESRGFDVRAPDLPGFGAEPVPTEPFSFVDRLAAHLPAILVGNSFGGRIALETALAHPDAVPRLMLIAPGIWDHDWSSKILTYWETEEEFVARGDIDAAADLTVGMFAQPHVHATVRPMQRRAYELQLATPEPQLTDPDPPPLSKLTMQTLVVVGERDLPDYHAVAKRIVDEAPHAELQIIRDAGHLPSLETPDDFDRLLLEFIDTPTN